MGPFVESTVRSNRGVGLVSSMLALSLLAVFALVAAGLALNARRTNFNDLTHAGALMSADSGGEAAIAFLMQRPRPPVVTDMQKLTVNTERDISLYEAPGQEFSYDLMLHGSPRPRPGYDTSNFLDFFYDVDAEGEAGVYGESSIGLVVSKLTKMNYN